MRFRANIENVVIFQRVLQCVEKLQKRCIIKFTEEEMHIICNQESEDGVQVWSQIKKDALFSNYKIQSNAANVISLGLSPDALLQALRSASPSSSSNSSSAVDGGGVGAYASIGASEVVMRLAKKRGQAVLSLEIIFDGGSGNGSGKVVVSHDVLIDVLKPAEMERVKEPMCPEPDIHILLPPLTKLRTVTEHLRQLADVLEVRVGRRGDLRLAVDTDDVTVETLWTKQRRPKKGKSAKEKGKEKEVDKDKSFAVRLSVRAFLKFLSVHVVSSTTIACVCEHHCMILYVYIGDAADVGGVLTFYIPARLTGSEY
ncbi:cell cycle checkpoint [Schizopora paradoxa]|uniref:Checkpoint protein n=1 Tax=Schizopora paradoxa TaxID=27342 RepID=A0A0H2SJQ0_9AGAM|nr:cell cycle checkpoint [Schizopora paradoxa]